MKIKLLNSLSPTRNNSSKNFLTPKNSHILSSPNSLLSFRTNNKNKKNIKLKEEEGNIFSFDEEYVSKLNYYSPELNVKGNKKETLYNINVSSHLPSLFKKYHFVDIKSIDEKKRLISKINIKKQIFEKNIYDNMEHTRYVGRLENMYKESTLEKRRHELEIKISKIKSLMNPLSKELSDTLNQIESLKIDLDIFKNYKTYTMLEHNLKKKNLNRESKTNLNIFNSFISSEDSFLKKGKDVESRLKIEKILKKKKTIIEDYKLNTLEKLSFLYNKKSNILVKLDACERDLKDFKEKHNLIRNELLVHYHKLLLEGKDTRKDGLSWIIQAIWNLKSNIIMSFMPKFLDRESISFLFIYSDKLVEISKIQKKIEKINNEIKSKEKKTRNLAKLSKKILNYSNDESNLGYMNIYYKNRKSSQNRNNEEDNKNNEININEKNTINNKSDNNKSNSNNNISINNKDENNKEENKVGENKLKLKINNLIIGKYHHPTVKNPKQNNIKRIFSQADIFSTKHILDINDNNIEEENQKTINSNFNLNFEETFKTSLYNSNSSIKDGFKSSRIIENKNNHNKNNNNIKINKNFKHFLFNQEYFEQLNSNMSPQKKIKVKDYENFKNFKIEDSLDTDLLQLFKSHKEIQKQLQKMKNEAEKLVRDELDRIGKCFYLEDYAGKYNTTLKIVIGALIGEDNVRNELLRQEKEQKDYFKTIKSIRNFNGICAVKYT